MRVDGAGSFYAYAQVGARQQTAVSGTGLDAVLTAASQPGGGAAASSSVSQYDFRKMTPDQMKGVAKDLYQSGKIDLSQLLILETAGVPIGKVGAKGEFVPLSASEKASYSRSRWIISRRSATRSHFSNREAKPAIRNRATLR